MINLDNFDCATYKQTEMIEWLAYEREKLSKAQQELKDLHVKLEKTNDLVEYSRLTNHIATVRLRIEAIESRLKNNWSKSRMETYSLKD